VYIILADRRSLYVGSARNVRRRLEMHRAGRGAKFTRDNGAVGLVYVEGPFALGDAIRREFQLKRWSRAKKLALIQGQRSLLHSLSQSRD